VYDTYGEAVIEGRPVGQGPDDGGWPKGDPDLGRWAALAAGGECGHNGRPTDAPPGRGFPISPKCYRRRSYGHATHHPDARIRDGDPVGLRHGDGGLSDIGLSMHRKR